MLIVEKQHVIEQLAACTADEPLRHRVHVRRPDRRPDHFRANPMRRSVERRAELVVTIPQQHGWRVTIHGGVAQLLCRPYLDRMARRSDVDHLPRCQVDDEECVDIRSAWFFTKVAQRWPPPLLPRTLPMYFWIVRLLTLIPTLSSSPRMRSAPHSRPRVAMSRIRPMASVAAASSVAAGIGAANTRIADAEVRLVPFDRAAWYRSGGPRRGSVRESC